LKFRVAGAFAVDRETRERFLSRMRESFAPGDQVETWSLPKSEPVLTLLVGRPMRPPLATWRADDGSAAIVDGDVYEVPGRDPRHSTAEAVFRLHEREGRDGLARLVSEAALVLFDATSRRLTLARDRFGVTPLFYAPMKTGLIFASDQRMLARLVERTLDIDALDFFLARGYIGAPWTLLREIRKLPASHVLEADGQSIKTARYARLTGQPKISPNQDDLFASMGKLLAQSLRRRYPSGAQGGVLLSGGVDSGLLVAGLVRLLGETPECFTFEYDNYQGAYNEAGPAARIAAHYGLRHHVVPCRAQELADRAPALVHAYGEPFSYGLHSFALDRLRHVSGPLLTGVASEPWGINRSSSIALRYRLLPRPVRSAGVFALSMAKPVAPAFVDRASVLQWSERTDLPTQLAPALLSDRQRRALHLDVGVATAAAQAGYAALHQAIADFKSEILWDQWRFLQQRSFGAESVYQWNTAWARDYELDIRHPYIDQDLFGFMVRVNFSEIGKQHQRNYAATIMPREFAFAPKVFHTIPIADWFRGPLRDFISTTLESSHLRVVFKTDAIAALLRDHLSGKADHAFSLWALASFALWSEEVFAAPASPIANRISVITT
jgi:asparagine synthase (glutamine-hydrolysing)